MATGRSRAGKLCWTNHSLLRELVEMENLLRLNSLYVTCMADLNSHTSTKPGCNILASPRRVWRCYPQLRMHWNFTQYVPTTRQRSGCKQTSNTYRSHLQWTPRPGSTIQEGCLKAVWTRLPPIPDACLELVTCGCKSKCRTVRWSCFRKDLCLQLWCNWMQQSNWAVDSDMDLLRHFVSFCHKLVGLIKRIRNACKLQKLQMLSLYEHYK